MGWEWMRSDKTSPKRSLSKSGLKAELEERLKKATIDKIPLVDIAKLSSGWDKFDKGCRWNVLEPTSAVEESSCEEPILLDPSSVKYEEAYGIVSVNKINKINYSRKFDCRKFVGEAFQQFKSLLSPYCTVRIYAYMKPTLRKVKVILQVTYWKNK